MKIFLAWILTHWMLLLLIGIALLVAVFLFLWLFRRTNLFPRIALDSKYSYILREYQHCDVSGNVTACADGDKKKNPELHKLQDELDRLPIGKILFNPPDTMRLGVQERVETRISRELHLHLRSKLKGSGMPQVEELSISQKMKVLLTGGDFNIIKLNEEEQLIGRKDFTEWAWDITPVKSGKKNASPSRYFAGNMWR